MMTILSNSLTTNHSETFMTLCQRADELVVVSPFCFPDFSDFASKISSVRTIQKVLFVTTLKKEEVATKIDYLLSFQNEMERIGVQWELHIDNRLHGKIYIFKKGGVSTAGIITSANLTHKGMNLNHEWGCVIEDNQQLASVEQQVLDDARSRLTYENLIEVKKRVLEKFPQGVKIEPPARIDIDDILNTYSLVGDTRIFIKPIGVSAEPIWSGDYSNEDMYFSNRRPNAVRVGDILIAYGVGSTWIIGAYKVTSDPVYDNSSSERWPWYVEVECLTPHLSNNKWTDYAMRVTNEANIYAEKYKKTVTNAGGFNLNALNRGSDKIQLSDDYGRYLLGKVMAKEKELLYGKE